MNPDFAIILNYQLAGPADADFLVKKARDIGARAVMTNKQKTDFEKAGTKYTIFLAPAKSGLDLNSENVIDTMVTRRQNGQATVINIKVKDGTLSAETKKMLVTINAWMHMFGHAFNEGQPCSLKTSTGFILENRHASYQKYVFLKEPLPEKVVVTGLMQAPNRAEWIEGRLKLNFTFKDKQLILKLTQPEDHFIWQVLRLQAHRPEDDLIYTKF